MIPRVIHQIWIGDKKMPLEWMKTWKEKHDVFFALSPWVYKVWTEEEIDLLPLKNREVYDKLYKTKEFCGAADVARIEILERFGGVYVDADLICLNSLQGTPFMMGTFFAAFDHEVPGHPGRINNAIIGAEANHPILREYIRQIGSAKKITPAWCTIGGEMLTDCVNDFLEEMEEDPAVKETEDIIILPAWKFWPENHNGQKLKPKGKVYSTHNWGTTKNKY